MAEALANCARGATPLNVALMRLFMAAPTESDARRALDDAIAAASRKMQEEALARLEGARRLWESAPEAYSLVATIHALPLGDRSKKGEARVREFAEFFDRVQEISPEAGVAWYSLAKKELLDEATREIVTVMRKWEIFDSSSRVLDFGCGPGRFLEALAPLVRFLTGIDISERMVEFARRRMAGVDNVTVRRGSGCDLSAADSGPYDLILAVDSFPYVVDLGMAEAHFAEFARVLAPDSWLLIFNYSYCGDIARDRAEVARLAARFGFTVLRNGTRDLESWDGTAFLLRKSASDHA